jgi:hypothetical protein
MKSLIRKILNEEVNDLFFRRRANELWNTIKFTYAYEYPCDYDTYQQFLSGVVDDLWQSEQHDWIERNMLADLKHFISNYFKLELLRHYDESCYSRDLFESEEKKDDSEIKEYMQYRVDLTIEKLRTHCDSFMAQFEDDNDTFDFLSSDVELCEYLRFVESVKVIDFEEEDTDRRNFLTIYVKITLTDEKYYYSDFQATLLMEIENFIQNYFHTKVEILEAA